MQAHIYIKGTVTGVFFRAHTREEAKKKGLTGWVRNVYDQKAIFGDEPGVETVFQGEKGTIEDMIEWLNEGSPRAEVEEVIVKWEEPKEEFETFEIRR